VAAASRTAAADGAPNVLQLIEDTLATHRRARALVPYRCAPMDVEIVGLGGAHADGGVLEAAAHELRALDVVARVECTRDRAFVRFDEHWVTTLRAALALGHDEQLACQDIAADRAYVVDYCNANATKALHVGHLRNVAVGNALASLARACGARTVTQSHVGDAGRSMGEAVAGCLLLGGSPSAAGMKPDHFVGLRYSRYVATTALGHTDGATDPALAREALQHGDLADRVLARWEAGDAEIARAWRDVRGWAVDGQDTTLARLGARLDRLFYESDYRDQTASLVARAVEIGVATTDPDGSVVYRTGRDEYPCLVLQRADGLPTQHARFLAVWHANAPLLADALTVEVIGEEWTSLTSFGPEILDRLYPGERPHPRVYRSYGMVRVDGRRVKSSDGTPFLLDDMLEALEQHPAIGALAGAHARATAAELTRIVALGYFIARPVRKPMVVSPDGLTDRQVNPAMAIACAWVSALDPAHDDDAEPATPDDPRIRLLVVQSQRRRGLLAHALDRLDPLPVLQYYAHLSRWFLEAPPTSELARAMRTVLRLGLTSLGLGGCPEPVAGEQAAVRINESNRAPVA
jgi:arginyl-tRNA synthetase